MSLVLLRKEEPEKGKKCWQLLSMYVVWAENFRHGSCNLMWSNLYLLSEVLKVNFLTDVSGTHLQSLLLGNSIFEGDMRGFWWFFIVGRIHGSPLHFTAVQSRKGERKRLHSSFAHRIYLHVIENILVTRMLTLFPVTVYTYFMLYVCYNTLNVNTSLNKYSNKRFVSFLTCT